MTNTVNNEGLNVKELFIAFIVSLVLMFLAGSGYAQGIATAKAADVTEAVSLAKKVKPVIVVPAQLAKTMVTGKVEGGKGVKSEIKKTQTYYYFQVTSSNNVGDDPCDLSTCTVASFPTNAAGNPMPPTSSPSSSCNPGVYCCVLAFSEDDIEHVQISPGVWVWRPISGSPTQAFEKRPTNPGS
ncbi:hypothetical protein SAMN05216436_106134 [bacterium A37T11]|nr:hypothetical protein SAMN05216436_106134 [bacterium A37T11]